MNVWDMPAAEPVEDAEPVRQDQEPEPPEETAQPLAVDPPAETGEPHVDRAIHRLTQADVLPTDRHGEVYEDVHRELREVLTGLDR
jgi:hypothetical protein